MIETTPNYGNRIEIGQITHAVTYLVNNAYKGHSSTAITLYLKTNFSYHTYTDKNGAHCSFDAADIWGKFFLKNTLYRQILDHRKINSLEELLYRSDCWHCEHNYKDVVEPSYNPIEDFLDDLVE